MFLKRFYHEGLAQASYLVGCQASGETAVIDANRNVSQYLEAAAQEGLRIVAVTETHIHADYVSGSRELAYRSGAKLYLSDEGDADWKYAFAQSDGAILVRNGDSIRIGNIRLDVRHTPGHTPEHISFLLVDEPASKEPFGAFTGDFVFVGDVGRPDLLERAADLRGTMEPGARNLFRSLKWFAKLPGHLLIWPSHGSGSACGKSLGGVPVTSLGYERLANWAFQIEDEDSFVDAVLAGQPEPPRYFAEMKRINKIGPPILGGERVPARLGGDQIERALAERKTIVDVRHSGDYTAEHIPGTLNIPVGKLFANWSGWLVPYDRPFYLVADSADEVRAAVLDLAIIGLDQLSGWFGADAVRAHADAGGELTSIRNVSVEEMCEARLMEDAILVDVRGVSEWSAGHVPGSQHMPLGYLASRSVALPKQKPVIVHCGQGTRSPIAASVLEGLGFSDVRNLSGGFEEYRRCGLPVEMAAESGSLSSAA